MFLLPVLTPSLTVHASLRFFYVPQNGGIVKFEQRSREDAVTPLVVASSSRVDNAASYTGYKILRTFFLFLSHSASLGIPLTILSFPASVDFSSATFAPPHHPLPLPCFSLFVVFKLQGCYHRLTVIVSLIIIMGEQSRNRFIGSCGNSKLNLFPSKQKEGPR